MRQEICESIKSRMHLVVPEPLKTIHRYIESKKQKYLADLKEAVAIQSISSAPNRRKDVEQMIEWTEEKINQIGGETERCDIGYENIGKGKKLHLPPVLLASFGRHSHKKTLLIYGHVDIYDAQMEDGWTSHPFAIIEKDGKLYGRGVADNKGPLLCWFNAIEAYKAMKVELPVNIKFIIEGMHEMGSLGITRLLHQQKSFFNQVDVICVSDGCWLTSKIPCIIYGTRGLLCFTLEVKGLAHEAYSGLYSGAIREPLVDLLFLLNSLQDRTGNLHIPGINDNVIQVTPTEEGLYDKTEVNMEELRNMLGVTKLAYDEHKGKVLQHAWRFPHLSFHGIEGLEKCGVMDSISKQVKAKFSIRIVQHQMPQHICHLVAEHLQQVWSLCRSPNQMKVEMTFSTLPWLDNPLTPYYAAAKKAIRSVYNIEPNLTRMGGSMPILHQLQEMNEGKNIILMPLSSCEDNVHMPNEGIITKHYYRYVKVFASFFYEVSKCRSCMNEDS